MVTMGAIEENSIVLSFLNAITLHGQVNYIWFAE
jgi:hypothetical protein